MIHIVIFYATALMACWFALRCGGLPERLIAAAFLIAAVGSSLVEFSVRHDFRGVDVILLLMDLTLLVLLLAVAAVANRFWPIWISALHLVAIAVHGVKAYDPSLVPWMYAAAIHKIAYPMLALLVIGTERHRRRKQLYGGERDWSLRPGLTT